MRVLSAAVLPERLRRLTPDRLRDSPRLRAIGVGYGLIPPRTMHADEEADLLASLASEAERVVEIGVYEGSSALVLVRAMRSGSELHLIDPFGEQPGALRAGWAATEWATRRVVERATGSDGPTVVWHVERSDETAAKWVDPVALVFIDGDHLEEGVRLDWAGWHPHVVPGGHVAFHDAREDQPRGRGLPGPTAVVNELFRGDGALPGWTIAAEVDRTVVVRRDA